MKAEAYKFEFANYLFNNINWEEQSNETILEIMLSSQKLKYTNDERGVQFIILGGRERKNEFFGIKDVEILRELNHKDINEIDLSERSMSFPALSAWIASLFPEYLYPVPQTGFDQVFSYLFGTFGEKFAKQGLEYILESQPYMKEIWDFMNKYPIEGLFLPVWNEYYQAHPELNIPIKNKFSRLDEVWVVQDFIIFVYREILRIDKNKKQNIKIQETQEPFAIEGDSKLASHLRYERDNSFINKIKKQALTENPLLNCQICGFSFVQTYGKIGEGFIEAHHKNPIAESQGKPIKTKREDVILVCSNCHRMLHRAEKTLTGEELRDLVKKENPDREYLV